MHTEVLSVHTHIHYIPHSHLPVLTCLVSLSQDYQEEISVAQENKQQLQVMGERLARASQDSKAAEIQHKLSKVSERWQHLLDLIAARWVISRRGRECCLSGFCGGGEETNEITSVVRA